MDERVRERRRSVGQQRGRRRVGVALAVVAVLAAVAVFFWLRSSDVFVVKRVTATSTEHVTTQQIYEAALEARGESLLRLSTAAIETRLSALPYVRSVEVHRRFPDTLEIRLVEYEPVAQLQTETGELWLVAEDGRALERRAAAFPLMVSAAQVSPVAGEKIPDALAAALPLVGLLIAERGEERLPPLDRIAVSAGGEVTVLLTNGVELRLGSPSKLEEKLMVAATVIEQWLRDDRQLQYVDARVPDRVAVKAK